MAKSAGVSTKAEIEALLPKATTYPVPLVPKRGEGVRGLYVQVTPAGFKSFVLRFRLLGRQKTLTLGAFPDTSIEQATRKALASWNDIRDGKNPSEQKRDERKASTVKELVGRFEREHLDINPGKGWADESKRLLKKHIIPALGSKRVKDVEPSDVAELLFRLRENTPTLANRVRSVCSKMFAKAELWGLRPSGSNPARGQDRADEKKKDRHLSDREIVALGDALRALDPTPEGNERPKGLPEPEDPQALLAIRLLLLTGMRKSELIGDKAREIPALAWTDVDLEAGVLRLAHHKTVKKVGARLVPLSASAMAHLDSHDERLGNPHVIVGRRRGESLVNLQDPWETIRKTVTRLQEKAKVPKKARVNIEDVTIHDLRRSFASVGARLGYPMPFIAGLLGHAADSVTEIYACVGTDPLHEAAEVIGARIAGLLDGSINPEREAAERQKAKENVRKAEGVAAHGA
jgi:integrase